MKRIHTKKEDDAHPLSLSPSSWEGLGVGSPYGGARGGLPYFPQGLMVITLLYDSGFTLYSSST